MFKASDSFNISKKSMCESQYSNQQNILAKNLTNFTQKRNGSQSPKILSGKTTSNTNMLNTKLNVNHNEETKLKEKKSNKILPLTVNTYSIDKPECLLDVKLKSYSRGPTFNKQYGKPNKTISDIFKLISNKKTNIVSKEGCNNEEQEEKELESISDLLKSQKEIQRGIKTAHPGKSRISLFNHPTFQRELHNNGPTPKTKDFIALALSEQCRLLYSQVAEPRVHTKDVALQYTKSDVFCEKEKIYNPSEKPKRVNSAVQIDYTDSDIFCIKNNKTSLSKAGEKPIASGARYNSATMSGSEWYPKTTKSTLMNHESTNLNILNMGVKGFSRTKTDIFEKEAGFCSNKGKSIAEYVDLFRNFSPNPNKKYLKAFENNKDEFKQTNNVCSQFGNLHQCYKGVSEPPFLR